VERLNGGVSLEEYMRENIWKPLGMDSTTFRLHSRPDIEARLSGQTVRLQTGELVDIPRPYPDPAPRDMGGAGGYTSVPDYMKLLTSLLRNDEKILAKRSVTGLFTPQLQDTTHFMAKNKREMDVGAWPEGVPLNHSLGGMVNMEDFPSGRRKGSLSWMGGLNLFWVSQVASISNPGTYSGVSGSTPKANFVASMPRQRCRQSRLGTPGPSG